MTKVKCEYTELVPTHKLVPNPKNPNKHPEKQIKRLAQIIDYQGMRSPIVVSKRSGFITKGHGRLEALKLLKWENAPVDYQDYDDEAQEYADIVADNAISEWAAMDLGEINKEMLDLGPDFDIDMLGIEDFVIEPVEKYDEETQDDVPEAPAEPKTKPGDVWLLGKSRLLCGDSTNIEHVEVLMKGELADQLVTDPPYNVNYEGGNGLKIKNDQMDDSSFRQFLRDAMSTADSVMKPGAVFYIWHADSEGYNFRGACHDVGWKVRQCLIWEKDSLVMGRQDYHWKHEPCLYGWKEGSGHLWASDRKQTTILNFAKPKKNDVHPTMKPVSLIEYQILNNTKAQDLVLDLFLGSGSTLIAAEKNNRRCFGLELDPKYCDVIVKRWQDFTGKDAILESTGEAFNGA